MRERARSCEALCECANAEPERVNVRPESANGRPAFANVVLGRCYPAFMSSLPIHIFSDIACPWCYVGKRRLEAASSVSSTAMLSPSPGARSSSIPRRLAWPMAG